MATTRRSATPPGSPDSWMNSVSMPLTSPATRSAAGPRSRWRSWDGRARSSPSRRRDYGRDAIPGAAVSKLWGMYRLGRLMAPLTDRALRSEAGRTRLLRGTVAKPLNLSPQEARDLIETYNSTATFTKHLAQTRRARFRDGTSIRVPVTVAWGDDEQLIPAKARRQDELPPHTNAVMLSGCGHVPFWDDPEQVARTILETTSGGGLRHAAVVHDTHLRANRRGGEPFDA